MKYALALTASAALALSSCTGVRVETDDVPQPEGSPIRLAVLCDGEPGTKSMLDESSFKTEGNALQIWDAYYNDVQTTSVAYLDGKYVVSDGPAEDVWPFRPSVDNTSVQDHYYWTKTGVHRFYGVLVKDQSSGTAMTPETLFGNDCGFGKSASAPYKYVVPTKTMTLDSPQFDFLYSNVIERNLDNGGGTGKVSLQFSHLFSAFAFTLTNDSPSELKLKDVSLKAVTTSGAVIDYSDVWNKEKSNPEKPVVSYSLASASSIPGIVTGTSSVVLPVSTSSTPVKVDLFNHVGSITGSTNDAGEFKLAWPQTLTDKGCTIDLSYEVTVTKPYYYYSQKDNGGWDVSFTYKGNNQGDYTRSGWNGNYTYNYVGENNGSYAVSTEEKSASGSYERVQESKEVSMDVNQSIPLSGEWLAGNRYLYNLSYSNNEIVMTVSIMKWDEGHGGDVTFE